MNKRGQLYILVALVMSIIIYGMVTISNRVEQESVNSYFESLSNNYAVESAKLINSLSDKQDEIPGAFKNFSLLFTSYSKTQNQKFELIYAFDFNDTLYIGNYLKSRIFFCTTADCSNYYAPLEGCYSGVPASVSFDGLTLDVNMPTREILGECEKVIEYAALDTLYITINEITYQFDIRKDRPEVFLVSWESQAEQRKVFTGGNLITEGTGFKMSLSKYCHDRPIFDGSYCVQVEGLPKANCGLILSKQECDVNDISLGGDCAWSESVEKCILG